MSPVPPVTYLTETDLNNLISSYSGSTFTSLQSLVSYVKNLYNNFPQLVTTVLNNIVINNTDFNSFEDYLNGVSTLNREELRNALRYAIEKQRDEKLDQTSMADILLRELLLVVIENKSGDPFNFRTSTDTTPIENFGKYYIE